jgi:hypothetical protein
MSKKEKKMQKLDDKSKMLIDELSKMPPMVIATAYLHAVNYILYGEDVTEKWETAMQNATALEKAYREGYNDALQRHAESEKQEIKTNTHIVIKREDILKYLTDNQIKYLDAVLNTIADGRKKDGKKTNNSYYICNTDEPYANEVLEVILKAESEAAK